MDFGDVLFFIVFVIIIVSNIMKQMKKAGKKSSEKTSSGTVSTEKKSGWKDVLGQVLEEARKQMEEANSPESGGTASPRKRSGWEDLMPDDGAVSKRPLPKRPVERKTVKKAPAPVIQNSPVRERPVFRPECMKCGASMKPITDFEIPDQSGLIYCDDCGAQHKYRISNGELKLKRVAAAKKPERRYAKVAPEPVKSEKISKARPQGRDVPAGISTIDIAARRLSTEELRNAVVWAEILGPPRGLRDLEM